MEKVKNYAFWSFNQDIFVLEDVECSKCWKILKNKWAMNIYWQPPNCYWEQCCWWAMLLKTNNYKDAFNTNIK